MIYGYILPADRVMNFPASEKRWEEEKTVSAVCATTPEIKEELEELAFKECGAYITATPHKETGLPPAMEWNRFQWITIEIDHYQDHSGQYRWAGMRQTISSLSYGHAETLPDITIRFHEDEEDHESSTVYGGDGRWTEDIPTRNTYRWHGPCDNSYCGRSADCTCGRSGYYSRYPDPFHEYLKGKYNHDFDEGDSDSDGFDSDDSDNDNSNDAWLKTTGDCYGNPIAIEILDHFLELPPCKSAFVHPLRGLEDRRSHLRRHDPEGRIFDGQYYDDLCAALEFWLKGDRDGIELPAGISKDYGEPRLEQMAYQKRWGRFYCDGG